MTEALAHRGPDDSAVLGEAGGLWLGFRRLAIQDLSPAGRQPMVSACGRHVLVMNGEIYNHFELRARLEAAGAIAWRGHADSETLVEAIAAWGISAALDAADGMFALAAWDRQTRTLSLARDPFGEKPLYYRDGPAGFAFASELTALERAPGFERRLDPQALSQFLRYGYVGAPRCIWAGVSKLAPGGLLTLTQGEAPRLSSWFDLSGLVEGARAEAFTDEHEAREALDALLARTVKSRMIADAPLGAFLSGGVDSSLVVALMQQAAGSTPVRTFTLGFERPEFDEAPFAREVAAHLGARHSQLIATDADARALAPRLAALSDEPFADPSQIPTLMISQLARREVTVCLTGDGADEVFGGYSRYAGAPRLWRALRRIPAAVRSRAAAALQGAPLGLLDAAGAVAGPLARRYAAKGRMGGTLRQVGQWVDAPSQAALYDRTLSLFCAPQSVLANPCAGASTDRLHPPPQGLDATETMLWRDSVDYLPGDILYKVDRSSMAYGLETRAPYLAREVAGFAWRLPIDMKVRDETTKRLLREVLDRHIPAALTHRPKRGFTPPIGAWLTGPLHAWARDLTASQRLQSQGLLNSAAVERLWSRAMAGDSSVASRLWAAVTLEGWLAERGF